MTRNLTICLVEPSAIICAGIREILCHISSKFEIIEIIDYRKLTERLNVLKPHVLIINPCIVNFSSIEILRENFKKTKIIALISNYIDEGILNYFDDCITTADTIETIKEKIITKTANKEDDVKKELSNREKEVLVYVVKGLTNKEISDEMCISIHTVVTHRRNIVSKLGIHSVSGLTIYAITNKMVTIDEFKN
ncbi:MAG: response regulator transcription factor [Bacteroidales bacterium]